MMKVFELGEFRIDGGIKGDSDRVGEMVKEYPRTIDLYPANECFPQVDEWPSGIMSNVNLGVIWYPGLNHANFNCSCEKLLKEDIVIGLTNISHIVVSIFSQIYYLYQQSQMGKCPSIIYVSGPNSQWRDTANRFYAPFVNLDPQQRKLDARLTTMPFLGHYGYLVEIKK